MDLDDTPQDISFELDGEGRPVGLSLSSGWRDHIPTSLLSVMLTAELARTAVAEPVVTHPELFRADMWVSRADQVQDDLAQIQRQLVEQLHRLTQTEDLAELGVTVRSANGMVVATILMGRVVRIAVDAAWAQRVASSEVIDKVNECLAAVNAQLDEGSDAMGGIGDAMSRLREIGRELSETRRSADGHVR